MLLILLRNQSGASMGDFHSVSSTYCFFTLLCSYHFLVHNASVLLWEICRPHRRPGWTGLCVRGWQSVAKALETVREDDHSWRLDILL